jgi:hypothetical protein
MLRCKNSFEIRIKDMIRSLRWIKTGGQGSQEKISVIMTGLGTYRHMLLPDRLLCFTSSVPFYW